MKSCARRAARREVGRESCSVHKHLIGEIFRFSDFFVLALPICVKAHVDIPLLGAMYLCMDLHLFRVFLADGQWTIY